MSFSPGIFAAGILVEVDGSTSEDPLDSSAQEIQMVGINAHLGMVDIGRARNLPIDVILVLGDVYLTRRLGDDSQLWWCQSLSCQSRVRGHRIICGDRLTDSERFCNVFVHDDVLNLFRNIAVSSFLVIIEAGVNTKGYAFNNRKAASDRTAVQNMVMPLFSCLGSEYTLPSAELLKITSRSAIVSCRVIEFLGKIIYSCVSTATAGIDHG